VVVSPPFTHVAIGLDVLRAGKHLLIEKPMAIKREDAAAIVTEAAAHPELVALEGSCRHSRLNPKFTFIKALIDSGKLGRIYHIHHNALGQGTFVEYNPNGAWAMDKRFAGGGPYMDWGEYDLSFHLGILGDRPQLKAVHAFTITGLRDLSKLAPVVDIEMHGAAYMEFNDGLTYYYERGAGVHGETQCETRLYGTQGGLRFYYPTWENKTVEYFHASDKPETEVLTVDMGKHPAHDNIPFVAHFLDCLEGKAQPMMPVSLAAKHLNILFDILAQPGRRE
jgi:predicted dehydrogenase